MRFLSLITASLISLAATQSVAQEVTRAAAAQFETRISQNERALRELTGKVEELEFENRALREALEKAKQDFEFRLNEAPTSQPATSATKADGTQSLGALNTAEPSSAEPKTVKDAYDEAFALLRQNEYPAAITAFNKLIDAYPDHELAGNAHYWLGEAYYVQNDFEQASVYFARGYKKFSSGNKAPDNLLKLGLSLSQLGKTPEACTTFEMLFREFPNIKGTIRTKAEGERTKLQCS